MQCPKCGAEFELLSVAAVDVARCGGCGGIWLDAEAKERLEGRPEAALVDTGNARDGRRFNDVRGVACPGCGVKMSRFADQTQFHIEYESCPECGGTFFDAGELKDLSQLSTVERIRKLFESWLAIR